jgi:hypothetical protein
MYRRYGMHTVCTWRTTQAELVALASFVFELVVLVLLMFVLYPVQYLAGGRSWA